MCAEELVERRLGDRADWGEKGSVMILNRRSRQIGRVGWWRGKPGVDYDEESLYLGFVLFTLVDVFFWHDTLIYIVLFY